MQLSEFDWSFHQINIIFRLIRILHISWYTYSSRNTDGDAVYSVYCKVRNIHCIVYTIYYTLYTIQYTLYNVHYILYTIHYALYTLYTLYTTYTLYTVLCNTNYTRINRVYRTVFNLYLISDSHNSIVTPYLLAPPLHNQCSAPLNPMPSPYPPHTPPLSIAIPNAPPSPS